MKQIFFSLFLLTGLIFPSYLTAQNGIVKTFYDDGTIESEISYINDILDGISLFYFPNGNLREEISFSYGKVNGIQRKYFPNGLIKEEKNLNDGILDGLIKIYYANGGLKEALNYENGKLLKKILVPFDSTYTAPLEAYLAGNRQYKFSKDANIAGDSEICPVPLNGIKDIENNLIYPKESVLNGLEGTVTLSVKIDTAGNASGCEIIKSLKKEYDLAAIKAVEKTKFLPGKTGNKVVDSKIVLSVEFKGDNKISLAENKDLNTKEIIPFPKTETLERKEQTTIPVSIAEKKTEELKKSDDAKNDLLPVVDQNPVGDDIPFPIGGIERIIARMVIPQKAIESKINGEVIYKVEVDKYGVVRNTKLIKGIGYGIDEAVEIAILDSPFKAAKKNGNQIGGEVTLKVPFAYKK